MSTQNPSYRVFSPRTLGNGEKGLGVRTVELGQFYEREMWAVTAYLYRSSPMAERIAAEPVAPARKA